MKKTFVLIVFILSIFVMPFSSFVLADENSNIIYYEVDKELGELIQQQHDSRLLGLEFIIKHYQPEYSTLDGKYDTSSGLLYPQLIDNFSTSNQPLNHFEYVRFNRDAEMKGVTNEFSRHLFVYTQNIEANQEKYYFSSEEEVLNFKKRLSLAQKVIPNLINDVQQSIQYMKFLGNLTFDEYESRYTQYDDEIGEYWVYTDYVGESLPDNYHHENLKDYSREIQMAKETINTLRYLEKVELVESNFTGGAGYTSSDSNNSSDGVQNSSNGDSKWLYYLGLSMLGSMFGVALGPSIRFTAYKRGNAGGKVMKVLDTILKADLLLNGAKTHNFLTTANETMNGKNAEKLKRLSKSSKFMNKTGKVLRHVKTAYFALGAGYVLINNDIKKRATWEYFGDQTFKATATAGATIIGAGVGGGIGAITGGAIGSIFGPQGTITGGTIGAFTGGMIGSYLGESIASPYIEEKATFGQKVGSKIYDIGVSAQEKYTEYILKKNGY